MKKFLLLLLALCSFIFYYFWLPASTPYVSTSLPMQDKMLLLPLDSRPPCTFRQACLHRCNCTPKRTS